MQIFLVLKDTLTSLSHKETNSNQAKQRESLHDAWSNFSAFLLFSFTLSSSAGKG